MTKALIIYRNRFFQNCTRLLQPGRSILQPGAIYLLKLAVSIWRHCQLPLPTAAFFYKLPKYKLNSRTPQIFIKPIILISSLLLHSACEKEITVDLPKPDNKIVVEGYIEEGLHPYIFLTRNSPYFETVTINSLNNLIVRNATVTVSDGVTTEKLDLIYDTLQFPFYKYVGDTIVGVQGKSYSLKVMVDGKELSALTTIPHTVNVDSIMFKMEENHLTDSLGLIWFYFIDPDTLGNYYKIYTKVFGRDSIFYHPYTSVSDDKIINGQFVEFSTYKGQNPFDVFSTGDPVRYLFKPGERVVFKLTSIDVKTFEFWNTLEMDAASSGNPFGSPMTVRSNIKGEGGLGIWGGYGASFDTLLIK